MPRSQLARAKNRLLFPNVYELTQREDFYCPTYDKTIFINCSVVASEHFRNSLLILLLCIFSAILLKAVEYPLLLLVLGGHNTVSFCTEGIRLNFRLGPDPVNRRSDISRYDLSIS